MANPVFPDSVLYLSDVNDNYKVIGLMSGTSLDGLDIAHCTFSNNRGLWSFTIDVAETVAYSGKWSSLLKSFPSLGPADFISLHVSYGKYLGEEVLAFIERHSLSPDFIASHGHTIFHQPHKRFTFQAGDGSAIAAVSGFPVVFDFRSSDVAMGGQGAPLVPVGDRLLFGNFSHCLNLGGIANISYENSGSRVAFDVCPCNLLLNHLSNRLGLDFDRCGLLAADGRLIPELLERLDRLPYYVKPGPKSLGREDIEVDFLPLLIDSCLEKDLLRTVVEHIARRIASVIHSSEHGPSTKILTTGGGVWNDFLIERIGELSGSPVVVPEKELVDFKEALVFAFLGTLRWTSMTNVYASVTGASADHCAGSVVLP